VEGEDLKMKNKTVYNMDGSIRGKFSSSKLTSKRTLSVLAFMVLAVGISAPGVIAQGTGIEAVELGGNGVFVNQGVLDMKGNDIESSGTTIWDASAGEVPSSVVGLNLSNSAGDFMTYDSANDELDVDAATIRSGTTASDVGLGNVENENALAQDGSEPMTGDLNMSGGGIKQVGRISISNGNYIDVGAPDDMVLSARSTSSSRVALRASGDIDFKAGYVDNYHVCTVESNGDWICDGTKSWRHQLNETHNAVYNSQESPQVRAVYEGQTKVTDGVVNVTLPSHFSGTVSDSRPSLRVQATPHSLVNVAVTERTDDYLVIKADTSETVEVDYRITGIREGYEDKQVVRPKE